MNNIELLVTGIFIGMLATMFSLAFVINHFYDRNTRELDNE